MDWEAVREDSAGVGAEAGASAGAAAEMEVILRKTANRSPGLVKASERLSQSSGVGSGGSERSFSHGLNRRLKRRIYSAPVQGHGSLRHSLDFGSIVDSGRRITQKEAKHAVRIRRVTPDQGSPGVAVGRSNAAASP